MTLPHPDVRLLGRLQVPAVGTPDPQLAELVVLLALHPEGLTPEEVAAALWPRHDPAEAGTAARALLARVAAVEDADGAVRLQPPPAVDTELFRTAVRERRTGDGLDLLRGPLLPDRPAGRYAWLAGLQRSLPALVVDACARLARTRLEAGDAAGAAAAARAGLLVLPLDERLWRELLRAEAALGGAARVAELGRELGARRAAQLPPYDRVQAETRELLAELRLAARAGA